MDTHLPLFEGIRHHAAPFENAAAHARAAGWNVFKFPSWGVPLDFLSDSGTGPLSPAQTALIAETDCRVHNAYGMRQSFWLLSKMMGRVFGLGEYEKDFHFFPFPQGRAAEAVFFGCLRDALAKDVSPQVYGIVPSNSHFDTTRANIELAGMQAKDFPVDTATLAADDMFRGNMDIEAFAGLLGRIAFAKNMRVPVVFMTVTNNTRGGLPVSMENIRETNELCRNHKIPFFLDAARFAENAYFIKKYERGYEAKTILAIVHEMFSYCDGFLISFKKDGLSHTGGGMVLKKNKSILLERYPGLPDAIATRLIITMSNDTQGAIPGGYQLAIAEGLRTAVTEEYLEMRVSQVARFGKMFTDAGLPVLEPFGGHAVYLDVDRFFADTAMRREDFGGIALTGLLLLHGVRACELGAFAFGTYDPATGKETFPDFNFVRFAVPRREYDDGELAVAVQAVKKLYDARHTIPRAVPVYGRDLSLRHFKARFELRVL